MKHKTPERMTVQEAYAKVRAIMPEPTWSQLWVQDYRAFWRVTGFFIDSPHSHSGTGEDVEELASALDNAAKAGVIPPSIRQSLKVAFVQPKPKAEVIPPLGLEPAPAAEPSYADLTNQFAKKELQDFAGASEQTPPPGPVMAPAAISTRLFVSPALQAMLRPGEDIKVGKKRLLSEYDLLMQSLLDPHYEETPEEVRRHEAISAILLELRE